MYEEDRERQRKREDAGMALQAYNTISRLWLVGSVLVPLLVLYLMGDWLDAKLAGHGAWMFIIILGTPVVSVVLVAKFIVAGVLYRRYMKTMQSIYPDYRE
jgi:hypothetical protein